MTTSTEKTEYDEWFEKWEAEMEKRYSRKTSWGTHIYYLTLPTL